MSRLRLNIFSTRGRTVVVRIGREYVGKYFSFLGDLVFTETGRDLKALNATMRRRREAYNSDLREQYLRKRNGLTAPTSAD